MNRSRAGEKLNNKGSALVLVLTIISFIVILGVMAMSTALLNVKIRGLNRGSDKNFYLLETALDEIYAETGRQSSQVLKNEYAEILSGLYQKDEETGLDPDDRLDANEKANDRLKQSFIKELAEEFDLELKDGEEINEDNCIKAAGKLKGFATSFTGDALKKDHFNVTVKSVIFHKSAAEAESDTSVYSGVTFKGLCLTYLNTETDIESALTVDLKIETPYVGFLNNGGAMLDYILAANNGIEISSSSAAPGTTEINGNVYGKTITVDHSDVRVNSRLMTAKDILTVKQSGRLELGPDTEAGGQSRVWADAIVLDAGSSLSSEDTSLFVRDDMTLTNNANTVKLSGSYYGYGNEGNNEEKVVKETKDRSSAILLNDKKSTVDLRGLDSLMLAGRAYLRFNTAGGYSQYIYPMGESLAVRATQSMYLVPEEYLSVQAVPAGNDDLPENAGVNPILFPDGQEAVEIRVSLPADQPTDGSPAREESYMVTRSELETTGAVRIGGDDKDKAAFLVALNSRQDDRIISRIYVYYNFQDERQRSLYFNQYLVKQADSFEELLNKGGVTGNSSESGIYISDGEDGPTRILTSGSLYQVSGNRGEEGGHLFELLNEGQDQISSSMSWVQFEEQLSRSFVNLTENLSEIRPVTGGRETQAEGGDSLLPVGNFVKLSGLGKPVIVTDKNRVRVYLTSGNVSITLNGDEAVISSTGNGESGSGSITADLKGCLVVSGKDVTIEGNGSFTGLIMAGGKISIDGQSDVTLDADSSVYETSLSDRKVSRFFYDYSDVASVVLNHYGDFVTMENWSRTGLEQGGGTDE